MAGPFDELPERIYGSRNGSGPESGDDEARRVLEAMEEEYNFPAFYPVVLIARGATGFDERLQAAVAAVQGEAPFRIRERPSSQGTYISYRVELFVADARTALARKAMLAGLSGVLVLL